MDVYRMAKPILHRSCHSDSICHSYIHSSRSLATSGSAGGFFRIGCGVTESRQLHQARVTGFHCSGSRRAALRLVCNRVAVARLPDCLCVFRSPRRECEQSRHLSASISPSASYPRGFLRAGRPPESDRPRRKRQCMMTTTPNPYERCQRVNGSFVSLVYMVGSEEVGNVPPEEGVWGNRLTRPPASACPLRLLGGGGSIYGDRCRAATQVWQRARPTFQSVSKLYQSELKAGRFGPAGPREISRWRQPPERCHKETTSRQGRQKFDRPAGAKPV